MNVPHLLPTFLLLLMTATAVHCFHMLCSWNPGPLPPAAYGFDTHWCKADMVKMDNDSRAQFKCDDHMVADWNYLGHNKLEMAKACPGGGFAYGPVTGCDGVAFARCLGDAGPSAPNITCLYTNSEDDCEWPDKFEFKDLPSSIDVWVKQKHWRRESGRRLIS